MTGLAFKRRRVACILALPLGLLLSGCGEDETEQRAGPTVSAADTQPATGPRAAVAVDERESTESTEVAEARVPEPATAAPAPAQAPESSPAASASTGPTQHVVQGVVTQWRPMILFVEPGDQVVFRQMSGHDSESMEGLVPEGAKHWKSQLGEEGFSIAPEVPGAYIYKCNPHVSTGMVGAIVVGEVPPANLATLQASPLNKGMIGRAIRKLTQAIDSR